MSAQPDPFVIPAKGKLCIIVVPAKAGTQGLGAGYHKGSIHFEIVSKAEQARAKPPYSWGLQSAASTPHRAMSSPGPPPGRPVRAPRQAYPTGRAQRPPASCPSAARRTSRAPSPPSRRPAARPADRVPWRTRAVWYRSALGTLPSMRLYFASPTNTQSLPSHHVRSGSEVDAACLRLGKSGGCPNDLLVRTEHAP